MYKIVNNYELYEYTTDNVIHVDTNKNRVQKLYKNLMAGSGFNGNTPPFFSNNYSSGNKKESI